MGERDPPPFDTGAFAPADRFEVWRLGIAGVLDGRLPPRADARSFHAMAECRIFGSAAIVSGELSAVDMTRSRRQIAHDKVECFSVVLYESGEWVGEVTGRRLLARPRVPVLLDMSRPFSVAAETGRYMILNLARSLLEDLTPAGADLHGVTLDKAAGALLREQMLSLNRYAAELPYDAGDVVARGVASAVAACVPRDILPSKLTDANLRRQAIRYIDGVLHDPTLGIESTCAALGVSRSALYRAFAGSVGIMTTIRDRRLRQVARILSDPRDHRPIAEVRSLYGFDNAAYFSTAFSRQFGCSPRQARNRAQDAAGRHRRSPVFDHHGWTVLEQ